MTTKRKLVTHRSLVRSISYFECVSTFFARGFTPQEGSLKSRLKGCDLFMFCLFVIGG